MPLKVVLISAEGDSLIAVSYDEIKNPYKRMVKIVDEVERLSQMNDKEIKSFLTKIKYIAEHNYKILIKEHTLINKAFNEIKEITK